MSEQNSRRQFLRNTTLATLTAGLLPQLVSAESKVKKLLPDECNPTTIDYYGQGPFYTPSAPFLDDTHQLADAGEAGTRLIVSGLVRTLDCTASIAGAVIDIWHANNAGQYDNSGYNLRGRTLSNSQGFYTFETILPGKYLNGASYRPRHIHFKITAPGYPTLTTQIYFAGDTDIPADAAASITSGTYNATHRIIPIALNAAGKYEGNWEIIINGDGTVGIGDIHLDKGIIYSVNPSPFTDTLHINYGIFKTSKVSLQVFDMKGDSVAILDQQVLEPHKYEAVW